MGHILVHIAVLLCTFQPLCAHVEEYRVALGSETALHPTAILPPPASECRLISQDYSASLIDVLAFDIDMNGMMFIVDEKKRAALYKLPEKTASKLREIPLSYLITCHIDGTSFSVEVLSLVDEVTKKFSPIPLSKNLGVDRARIHQLSDFLFHELFGLEGVASTRLLYSKSLAKGRAEICVTDYDGGNQKQVTAIGSLSVTPQWIPSQDNGSFLFVSYMIGQPKIYIASTRSRALRRLTPMRGNQLLPVVSYDGKQVAFCSDILGTSDLYMLTFDARIGGISKPRQIYKTPSCATACPSFSPDRNSIAFVSNKDGTPKVYTMPIPKEGAKLQEIRPTLITKRCRENTAPAWSPDGKRIAYTAKSDSQYRQIWIYDIEQAREYQLTDGPGSKENPSWASNSLHLAYQGMNDAGVWGIYIVNLHQKKPKKITLPSENGQFPSWERHNTAPHALGAPGAGP